METIKAKSAVKEVHTRGPRLEKLILQTMSTISDIVGATLGPGGQPVLIERYEHGMPASISKDGVTVFRSLGFDNPVAHCIMEAARDAAVRTASEAGDGTTSSTILAEAVVRLISAYCKKNPRISPQRVVRRLETVFKQHIEPAVLGLSRKVDFSTDEGKKILYSVAKVSANGDDELAEAVMECFELVGDHGNVTIAEQSGPSSYQVDQIDGYPIPMGYEESCGKFYPKFINDQGSNKTVLDNPIFIVYHGVITEIQTLLPLLRKIGEAWEKYETEGVGIDRHNVVIVATGFSESVIGHLASNFPHSSTINAFPLVVPKSPQINGQLGHLQDICAITGATLLDPLNRPLDTGRLEDLGPGTSSFESTRFRSTIVGYVDEDKISQLADIIEKMLLSPESEMDKFLLQERLGKVTGGIAKLTVVGPSSGELKEKRDRAEDAVCAVRGAIKAGCLPGGGWTLIKLVDILSELNDPVIESIVAPALMEPVMRLLTNCGITEYEIRQILEPIIDSVKKGEFKVYNALEQKFVDAFEGGILDSTPAVLEAIRSSISIAALLGTLGGAIVFYRNSEFEMSEAKETSQYMKDIKE